MKDAESALSFRAKIVLLGISIAVAASVLHGAFSYRDIVSLSRDRAIELLANETRLNGERFLTPFRQMQQDAAVLAGVPSVDALVRIVSGTEELVDGEGLDAWRRRLEVVFRSQLNIREHYFQIRLIGIENGGREVVRLDVDDGEITATPGERLQVKGNEPYMRPFLGDDPPRTSFFWGVSRNREAGVVQPGAPWTIRLVHPVIGADDRVVGAIVLNADYDALIELADLRIHHDSVVAANFSSGDHVSVRAGAGLGSPGEQLAAKLGVLAIGRDEFSPVDDMELYSADDWTLVAFSETLPDLDGVHDVRLWTAMPTPVLMQSAHKALRHKIILSVLILVATAAGASAFGIRLTRPLSDLTARISKPGAVHELRLDTSGRDEIGRLARAFAEMSNELIRETGQARNVFDHAMDGLLTADGSGTILSMNPGAYRMFGHPSGSLTGQPISRLIPESYWAAHDGHMKTLKAGDSQPMAELHEVQALRADGTRFPVEVRVNRVSNDGDGLFVAVVHDISETLEAERKQRQLIEELEASNARLSQTNDALASAKADLERSNDELDKFAYVASHDLRAPLRVIDNASRWLEEDLAEFLDDDTRESMELLRGRVTRMERLLEDLLEHSRIGRVSDGDAVIGGPDLVENIRALTAMPEAFRFEVDDGFADITLNQFPVQTVLVNLVSNAVKHHDRADGQVSLSIVQDEDHLTFEVKDDGPGIPVEFQEKVFDMFKTLKPRDEVEGSGMGLAIVKKTVEVAGGTIHLTSAPGEGSLFRVTWPRAAVAPGREAAA